MRISGYWLRRQTANCLLTFLAVPFGQAAAPPPQQTVAAQEAEGASSAQSQSQNTDRGAKKPEAGTNPSKTPSDNQDSVSPQTINGNPQAADPQTTPEQKPNGPPLGTAAAPYEKGYRCRSIPAGRSGHCTGKTKAKALHSDQGWFAGGRRRCDWDSRGAIQRQPRPAPLVV